MNKRIALVLSLLAKSLTADNNFARLRNSSGVTGHKALPHIFRQSARGDDGPPQHRFGIQLVNILSAWTAAARERESLLPSQ